MYEVEWKILQEELDFTTSFSEYVNNGIITNQILSVDGIYDLMPDENRNESTDTEDNPIVARDTECKTLENFRRDIESQENVSDEIHKNLRQIGSFHLQNI